MWDSKYNEIFIHYFIIQGGRYDLSIIKDLNTTDLRRAFFIDE